MKKSSRLSSASPEIIVFISHCSANFQPLSGCFIPNVKLKYEDSENMETDGVNTVVFNLHQIKRQAFFCNTRYHNTVTFLSLVGYRFALRRISIRLYPTRLRRITVNYFANIHIYNKNAAFDFDEPRSAEI